MIFVPYNLGQGSALTINLPQPHLTVGGDNGTSFYLHLPGMPPGLEWVFPFTYGWFYPLPDAVRPILITSNETPPGYPAAPTGDVHIARFAGYQDALPFSPGVRQSETIQKNATINQTIGGSTTAHLIAAVPNQVVTLYWLAVSLQASAQTSVNFQSSATSVGVCNEPSSVSTTYLTPPPISWPFGFALPIGEGLDMVNGTANAVSINGAVVYTQA